MKSKPSKAPEEGTGKFGMKSIFQDCIFKYALFYNLEVLVVDFQKQQINSTYVLYCYLHGNEGNNSFNCRNLATASYAGNQSTARKRSDNRE
jgi:hypothetical protein